MDLSGVQKTVERLFLTDTCLITNDPQGADDDVLDEDTGILVPTSNPDYDILYNGSCAVSFQGLGSKDMRGGSPEQIGEYWLTLPMTAPADLPPLSLVTITAAGDPALVGVIFSIVGVALSTLAVSRRVKMERRTLVPSP